MSKHSTPEEKLKVSQQVRPKKQPQGRIMSSNPQAPPKGTNANNQYR